MKRIEAPLYRAIRFTAIGGIPYKVGETFEGGGVWPILAAVEPINATARAIADYLKRYGHSRCFPSRPYNDFFGCYYLPAALPDGFPIHDASGPRDSFPTYQDPADTPLYIASHPVHFANNVTLPRGKLFAWLRWPLKGWRTANSSAEAVARYLEQHGGEHPHPDLQRVTSPWCELGGGRLFLPDLPSIKTPAYPPPPAFTREPPTKHLVALPDGPERIVTIDGAFS